MEAFEQFVAIYLEEQGYVVSSSIKFPIKRQINRQDHVEFQTHGYEVDLIAARADRLILATVKSFLGSRGVVAEHVMGISDNARANKLYVMLHDKSIRKSMILQAAKRFGYRQDQVQLGLYVGRFSGPSKGDHEDRVRRWCRTQRAGAGEIEVCSLSDMVEIVVKAATDAKQYRDNPVLVTMRLLNAAGLLVSELQTSIDE
ncbi:MAG: hypothetical protein ABSE82_16865 [Nitrososphaerales archaeon]